MSAMPRFVIDTGALWSPTFLRQVAKGRYDLVLPSIAYTERARQMKRDGQDIRDLDRLLRALEIAVEDFTAEKGLRVAAKVTDDAKWERLSRDALIAGHLGREDVLVTTDPDDFLDLAVPLRQILDVPGRGRRARDRAR